jgi:hypothetical protein
MWCYLMGGKTGKEGMKMSFAKRLRTSSKISNTDACQTHCNAMGGSAAHFDTAHGQQAGLARKAAQQSVGC